MVHDALVLFIGFINIEQKATVTVVLIDAFLCGAARNRYRTFNGQVYRLGGALAVLVHHGLGDALFGLQFPKWVKYTFRTVQVLNEYQFVL